MKSCITHPRASDSSDVLTEARTVLMRAESALRKVESDIAHDGEARHDYGGGYGMPSRTYAYTADPDAGRVSERLKVVITELDPWRKCYSDCEGRK